MAGDRKTALLLLVFFPQIVCFCRLILMQVVDPPYVGQIYHDLDKSADLGQITI